MKDELLRKAIADMAEDLGFEEGVTLLDDHAFDKSIAGITDDGRAIYDYEKMVMEFAQEEDCTEEEAREWIDYNTKRAIPYMPKAPIIMTNINDVRDCYLGVQAENN